MPPLTEIHLFKGQNLCSVHANCWFLLLPWWLLANEEPSAPLIPARIAFTAFCTALKVPLALNEDKEDLMVALILLARSHARFQALTTPYFSSCLKNRLRGEGENCFCNSYSISEQLKQQDDFWKPLALGWVPGTSLIGASSVVSSSSPLRVRLKSHLFPTNDKRWHKN